MICRFIFLFSLVLPGSLGWTSVNNKNARSTVLSASSLLYEEHEKMLVRRGQFEKKLMEGNAIPIEMEVVKGAGSGGGFGGGSTNNNSLMKAQGKAHAKTLRKEGVARIDGVLSAELADELRTFVYSMREDLEEKVKNGELKSQDAFADVLLKENRCDLTIPLGSKLVADAIVNILQDSPVGATFESLLGKKAVLYELSTLMSDPGSNRQVMHPDTPCSRGSEPVLYTCFVALQDIDESMGPTTWMPKSHSPEAHEQFQDEGNETEESPKDKLLRTQPCVLGILKKGSCAIFDSRLLHCGGANESEKSRALFYFTFKNPKVVDAGNPGSIRSKYISKYDLSALRDEMKKYGQGKPSDLLATA